MSNQATPMQDGTSIRRSLLWLGLGLGLATAAACGCGSGSTDTSVGHAPSKPSATGPGTPASLATPSSSASPSIASPAGQDCALESALRAERVEAPATLAVWHLGDKLFGVDREKQAPYLFSDGKWEEAKVLQSGTDWAKVTWVGGSYPDDLQVESSDVVRVFRHGTWTVETSPVWGSRNVPRVPSTGGATKRVWPLRRTPDGGTLGFTDDNKPVILGSKTGAPPLPRRIEGCAETIRFQAGFDRMAASDENAWVLATACQRYAVVQWDRALTAAEVFPLPDGMQDVTLSASAGHLYVSNEVMGPWFRVLRLDGTRFTEVALPDLERSSHPVLLVAPFGADKPPIVLEGKGPELGGPQKSLSVVSMVHRVEADGQVSSFRVPITRSLGMDVQGGLWLSTSETGTFCRVRPGASVATRVELAPGAPGERPRAGKAFPLSTGGVVLSARSPREEKGGSKTLWYYVRLP